MQLQAGTNIALADLLEALPALGRSGEAAALRAEAAFKLEELVEGAKHALEDCRRKVVKARPLPHHHGCPASGLSLCLGALCAHERSMRPLSTATLFHAPGLSPVANRAHYMPFECERVARLKAREGACLVVLDNTA